MRRSLWAAAAAGAAVLLTVAGPARADELIHIPTADLVRAPTLEYLERVDRVDEGYGTLFFPAGRSYELMFRYYNGVDRQSRIEGGGQFQLLPDGIITPGIAVGLWDITNSSPRQRRAFLVVSKSVRQGQFGLPKPFRRVQFTLGVGTGRLGGLFAGTRVDLPLGFSLVGEYDSQRLNEGIWFTPVKPLTFKAELQNGNPYLGGELRLRF